MFGEIAHYGSEPLKLEMQVYDWVKQDNEAQERDGWDIKL